MIRVISVAILALALLPALVFAAELQGTVVKVDKAKNQLVVKTDKGEQTLLFGSSTKGMDNASPFPCGSGVGSSAPAMTITRMEDTLCKTEIILDEESSSCRIVCLSPSGKKTGGLNLRRA